MNKTPDKKKINELYNAINKLNTVITKDNQILQQINLTTNEQSIDNINTLSNLIQKNQENIADIVPQLELF